MNSVRRRNVGRSRVPRRAAAKKMDFANKQLLRLGVSLLICALGFALGRFSPQRAELISGALARDMDFEAVFSQIGEAIGREEGIVSVFLNLYSREEQPPEEEPAAAPEAAGEIPVPQTLADTPEELTELYLLSQCEYDYLGMPDIASAEMPEIDFAFTSPVPGAPESGFGYRSHPDSGDVRFHYGLDLAAAEGEEVCAFAGGTVLLTAESTDYGKYVQIAHEDGWMSLYAHLSSIAVKSGQELTVGQVIGAAGSTGNASGPHLHFELLKDELYINPAYYIAPESICVSAE